MAKFTWISSRTFDGNYQELLVQKFSREVTVKKSKTVSSHVQMQIAYLLLSVIMQSLHHTAIAASK